VRHGVQDVVMSSPYLEAVDVGDGARTDIEGARRAGLVGVWVDRGLAARPEALERPPASIRALADLRGVLGVASEQRSC
jgi:FMN phosphatase YigB (HAD superfamily)